jgi:hypothetical protein
MNKKRKILTLVALAVFSVIPDSYNNLQPPLIEDVRMPLFVLAVFYVGLFALLGDNKRKEQ